MKLVRRHTKKNVLSNAFGCLSMKKLDAGQGHGRPGEVVVTGDGVGEGDWVLTRMVVTSAQRWQCSYRH